MITELLFTLINFIVTFFFGWIPSVTSLGDISGMEYFITSIVLIGKAIASLPFGHLFLPWIMTLLVIEAGILLFNFTKFIYNILRGSGA